MLELRNITTVFNSGTPDAYTLFNDFSFTAQKGDFISVIGSNGSGKTTMLNLICGSLTPDTGKVLLDSQDITPLAEYKRARFIGRVYQDPKVGTCPSLTILENMALADNKGHVFGLSPAINRRRLTQYKELLVRCNMGLEDRLNARVGTLSGGQRQALALVIANICNVSLLILDEHTAALDPKSSETIMRLTDEFVRTSGITTIMVTHNLRYAIEYGNRIVMMHEGGIVLDRSAEDKAASRVDDLLDIFNRISIEKGN